MIRLAALALGPLVLASACASTGAVATVPPDDTARFGDWANLEKLEKLEEGTPIRVTERDGLRHYGPLMEVTGLELKLELVAGSVSIARPDVALVERFPASFPKAFPSAAVGVGAALAVSTASSPEGYRESVGPTQDVQGKESEIARNGVYVDLLDLVGTTVEMVDRAIESSRETLVVYRARSN